MKASKSTPAPQRLDTPAWLQRGIGTIPGQLVLSGGRLSFIAEGSEAVNLSAIQSLGGRE